MKERKSVLQKLRFLYLKRSQKHKNTDVSSEARICLGNSSNLGISYDSKEKHTAPPPASISALRLNLIFHAKSRSRQVTKKPPLEVTNSGGIDFMDKGPDFVRVEDSNLPKTNH